MTREFTEDERRSGAGQMGIQMIGRAQQGVGPGTGLR